MTSDEVGTAIDNGAATLAAVARATRACTSCGMCKERIRAMLGERGQLAPRVPVAEPVPAGLG